MIIMVTGATAGFGESITRRFIANGHKVIATGRREERLKTLKDELGDNLYIAGGNVYGATKAFVRQFSLNLRTDLHGTAVRVTDIEPGLVGGTEFSNVRFKGDDAKAEKAYENTQALTPEDVTEAVWWVATLPKHVNINTLEMMPVSQSFAGLSVHRQG